MAMSHPVDGPPRNKLLARLPESDYQPLLGQIRTVKLEFQHILYEPQAVIDYVYFPHSGVVSAIAIMNDGASIELATVGNEGMIGFNAFLGTGEAMSRMLVQVDGEATRMEAAAFRAEFTKGGPFQKLLLRYHAAFLQQVGQGVACNGLHTVQKRCCRWILMTHDRVDADEFPLTHEFLSHMLGVRRVSVTEVLKPLQDAGLILNRRGNVKVLDRKGLEAMSCECYQSVVTEYNRLLSGADGM